MQIKLLPESERPVEKTCILGIDKLSNSELLALIIHSGTRNKSAIGLAEDVLALYPEGISGLGDSSIEELSSVDGIGSVKASAVLAAVELGKRISAAPTGERISIEGADDIARMFMEKLRHVKKEHFKCVMVNTKGDVICVDDVSVGALSSTVVHPREVFACAIRKSAAAVIFVHNHPSGDPRPSSEDLDTTQRLVKSGELLGIRVLDHIIIGDGRFSSLREMGYID